MKIALTGATGFLGRHVLSASVEDGHDLRCWHRESTPPPAPKDPKTSDAVTWVTGELGNRREADELVNGCDVVVHAGLFRGGPGFMDVQADAVEYFRINVLGSLKLLEAAVDAKAARFIFVSSGAVHQRVLDDRPLDETHPLLPGSLYGAYKASVETLVHHYAWNGNIAACSLRPTSIYGVDDPPQQSKWFQLVHDVAAGKQVDVTGGSKAVHAADVARAILLLAETGEAVGGETFNCTDRMISNREVAEIAQRITQSDAELVGPRKSAMHQIDTTKLERLGMEFGGTARLESTVRTLLGSSN